MRRGLNRLQVSGIVFQLCVYTLIKCIAPPPPPLLLPSPLERAKDKLVRSKKHKFFNVILRISLFCVHRSETSGKHCSSDRGNVRHGSKHGRAEHFFQATSFVVTIHRAVCAR